MAVDHKVVPHSERILFKGWTFDIRLSDEEVARQVAEVIQTGLDQPDSFLAELPFQYRRGDGISGPPPPTPDTIHVHLKFLASQEDDMGPTLQFNVADLVSDLIDWVDDGENTAAIEKLSALRDTLAKSVAACQRAIDMITNPPST